MKVIDYDHGAFVVNDYLVRGDSATLEVSTAEGIGRGRLEGLAVPPTQVSITLKYNLQRVMNASGFFRDGSFKLVNLSLVDQEGLGDIVTYQEDLLEIFSNKTITAEIRKRQH